VQVVGYFSRIGNGAAACGFGIRSGDDVIRISKCNTPMTTKLFLNGDLTPNTKIYRQGQGNKVKVGVALHSGFPISNTVRLRLHDWYL
jgi:hypothetical protein